ncbi:helix-turn-helix domain-containing protein [Desulfosporosinus shakirovi]|uniref:helix-turn-helix domain-containing protein n=1 Tax=Desulfosporosinus shakirovi TaxID=2885154 RepID=UPI001E59D87C|nr:helix-turn-helix domain-containing protein [Desulfosporosinus sp. SRJS8]MCB8815269.1 helix-turn-helix domain-containing protein [Desulfosporosinus sp. SRJS8]
MKEVFWTFDHILIAKNYSDPAPHRHLAKHLIFCTEGEVECRIENLRLFGRGVCINSNIEHTVKENGKELLVFLFDETSKLSRELETNYLKGEPCSVIEDTIAEKVNKGWKAYQNDAKALDQAVLAACKLNGIAHSNYDRRINCVLERALNLEGIYEDTMDLLCREAFLSRSRLSHLFKEEVGVALSSYLVFEKMRKTCAYAAVGESLTSACIRAGFGSSSHFANTCKRMFGLAYSDFAKTALFQQIP